MESLVVQSKESFCYTGNGKSNKWQSQSFQVSIRKKKQENPVKQSQIQQQRKSIHDVMVFEE